MVFSLERVFFSDKVSRYITEIGTIVRDHRGHWLPVEILVALFHCSWRDRSCWKFINGNYGLSDEISAKKSLLRWGFDEIARLWFEKWALFCAKRHWRKVYLLPEMKNRREMVKRSVRTMNSVWGCFSRVHQEMLLFLLCSDWINMIHNYDAIKISYVFHDAFVGFLLARRKIIHRSTHFSSNIIIDFLYKLYKTFIQLHISSFLF